MAATSNSVQHKLVRVRPPRVKITYDVEDLGSIQQKEIPFVIGVFAPLAGAKDLGDVKARKMIDMDRSNFNDIMEKIGPQVALGKISVDKSLTEELGEIPNLTAAGNAELSFSEFDHFTPTHLIQRIDQLQLVSQKRGRLRDIQTRLETNKTLYAVINGIFLKQTGSKDELKVVLPGDDAEVDVNDIAEKLEATFKKEDEANWATSGEATLDRLLEAMRVTDDPKEDEANRLLLAQVYWDILTNADAVISSLEKVIKDEQAKDEPDETLIKATEEDIQATKLKGLYAHFDKRIAAIDRILSAQLTNVLHHDKFQELEATWRGLHYLVFKAETGEELKIRVISLTEQELTDDLSKAVEFDQSHMFKLIYEQEYGTYGGEPFSLLVGDYAFSHKPQHITLLNKVAELAASAHAPFIASAYSNLFNLQTFEDLAKPRDLAKIFAGIDKDKWRSFRDSEDSRYVALTLPKVMLRLPYGGDFGDVVEDYDDVTESVDGTTLGDFLWGNPAYMLAERVANSFSLYKWTAAIRGVEGGGLVGDLPSFKFNTEEGDLAQVCPTQVSITDRREKELSDLGFIALCHKKGTDMAAFFGGQTTNKPKKYLMDAANANSELSSRLPYLLCASRFAHYIKVLMREKVGSFMTRGNVESYLNNWISQFVLLDDDATQASKAAYPLRSASVVVVDVAGQPGAYSAIVYLQPHFQLEELTTSIRLVAEIPA